MFDISSAMPTTSSAFLLPIFFARSECMAVSCFLRSSSALSSFSYRLCVYLLSLFDFSYSLNLSLYSLSAARSFFSSSTLIVVCCLYNSVCSSICLTWPPIWSFRVSSIEVYLSSCSFIWFYISSIFSSHSAFRCSYFSSSSFVSLIKSWFSLWWFFISSFMEFLIYSMWESKLEIISSRFLVSSCLIWRCFSANYLFYAVYSRVIYSYFCLIRSAFVFRFWYSKAYQ